MRKLEMRSFPVSAAVFGPFDHSVHVPSPVQQEVMLDYPLQ